MPTVNVSGPYLSIEDQQENLRPSPRSAKDIANVIANMSFYQYSPSFRCTPFYKNNILPGFVTHRQYRNRGTKNGYINGQMGYQETMIN